MVRVGVVGLGFMGLTHLKAYRKIDGVSVTAVCDAVRTPGPDGVLPGVGGNVGTDDAVVLDLARTRVYRDAAALLADADVDLVDICLPTPAHPDMTREALRAGKHVVCEKPMARTSALAREMVTAAENARGYFMPAMCMRFWPGWDWLQETIDRGVYGRVLAARFRRVSSPPGWSRASYFKGTDSGGALLDLHIHDVDFAQYCFGRPRRVFATGLSRFSGAIDHVVAQYEVASGALVSAEGSWIMTDGFGFNMSYTVVWEKATADFDSGRGRDALRLCEEGQPPRTLPLADTDGYVGELTHLIECIQAHRPPSRVTGRDALSAVEICEAEEQSIRTGQPVAL